MPYREGADWNRLADKIRARRDELGQSQRDTAVLAGLSTNGYAAVERGNVVRVATLEAAERALQWAPGSARSILHGGEPTPLNGHAHVNVTEGEDHEDAVRWHDLPIALRAGLADYDVLDTYVDDLGGGVRIVTVGLVDRDIKDSDLWDALRRFDEAARRTPKGEEGLLGSDFSTEDKVRLMRLLEQLRHGER